MRRVIIYTPEKAVEFEEKKNCLAIVDVRSEYPVIKIYIDDQIHIYKGLPYMIQVDKMQENTDPAPYTTRFIK